MHPRRSSPQSEHRLRELERANNSTSLGEAFPKLKSLTVDLTYFDPRGITKSGEMRYKVNVRHAKSVFCFVCQSSECVGGDFDLTRIVAQAVAKRRKSVEGEVKCQGWRTKPKEEKAPCHNLLRYKLKLAYA